METLAGMSVTGRRIAGPASDLVELQSEDGVIHTAIVFEEKYRSLPVLNTSVDLARSFMEFPMVTGLVELTAFVPAQGAFVYPTGNARAVSEMIKAYRDIGKSVSKRAVLELCYLAVQILQEAAETGPLQGVYSHGDLDPARILVKPDGDVQIIGYGIPSPEVIAYLEDNTRLPRPEAVRYAPPERFMGGTEDASSDIYSLVAIAVEMMTGDPLFDGTTPQIIEAIRNGEAPHRLEKLKQRLGAPIVELLVYALNFDPRNRYASGREFVRAIGDLLDGVQGGETLAEAIAPVHARGRGKTLQSVDTGTGAFPKPAPAVRNITGRSIHPHPVQPARDGPVSAGRWGAARRGKRGDEEADDLPGQDAQEAPTGVPDAEPAEESEAEGTGDAGSRLRRRRRTTAAERDAMEAEEAKQNAEANADSPRRRRHADAEIPPATPAAEEGEDSRRRRRTRRWETDGEDSGDASAKGEKTPAAQEPAKPAAPAEAEAKPAEAEAKPADERFRSRRTRSGEPDAAEASAPPAAEAAPAADPEENTPRRRRRFPSEGEGTAEPAPAEAKPEEGAAPTPRRRLRRETE